MTELAHNYCVQAIADSRDTVIITNHLLQSIQTEAPVDFGGSGKHWCPEDLLMAAISDCFSISFKSIADASKFKWSRLICKAQGHLSEVDRRIKFNHVIIESSLCIHPEENERKARLLLDKAKRSCFVTNSLNCEISLRAVVLKHTDLSL